MTREEEIQKAAEEYATGSPQATLRYKAFKDGAKYADAHPAKKQAVTIKAWVARERFGALSLFKDGTGHMWAGKFLFNLNQYDFPSVTFENSPKKVKVTIELEDE